MTNWVIVRKSDLAILGYYASDDKRDSVEYNSYLMAEPYAAHVGVPEGLNPLAVECTIVGGEYHLSNDVDKEAALLAAAWVHLRAVRDELLSLSDWTQLADSPLSSGAKTSWATYRQALRDLPQNTEDPNDPTWPVAPS